MYAVVCRTCEGRILVASRLGDPQLAVMLTHLRTRHPAALPEPRLPEFLKILGQFRLRTELRDPLRRVGRHPEPRRSRALARAAARWGGVRYVVRGRLAVAIAELASRPE
jgi:hypothetical protein